MSYSFTRRFAPVTVEITNIDHNNRPTGHDKVASQYLVEITGEATRMMFSEELRRVFLLDENPTAWIAEKVGAAMTEWFMDHPEYGQAHAVAAATQPEDHNYCPHALTFDDDRCQYE